MAVKKEELSYSAANGKDKIVGTVWYDNGKKPSFILQIVHGMCEYMGRYEKFARQMAEFGAVVCGNDHAGHGKSKGEDGYGYFAKSGGDENFVKDVRAMNLIIKKRYPGLPVVMLGHSMGSFICRRYIMRYGEELAGIILSGTAGDNPMSGLALFLAKATRLFRGEKYRSRFLTNLAFGSYNKRYPEKRTQYDWLTRDTEVVDRYAADEGCNYMFTASGYVDLMNLMLSISGDAWAQRVPKDRPYYVIAGSMDPVGNYGAGVREVCERLKKAGVKDLTVHVYEGCRHELLNEMNRGEVIDGLQSWITEKCLPKV